MIKSDEVKDTLVVVTSIFSIHSYPITVVFDSTVSHSIMASGIVNKLKLVPSLG